MIRRPPRSTLSSSSAASDVYKRQIGAICATEEVSKAFTAGSHGTTFGGHPISCAAALAEVGELLDRDLAGNAKKVGDYFAAKLEKLPHVKEVRHQGLLVGVEFDDTISGVDVKHGCFDRKLLITAIGAHIIRTVPVSYTHLTLPTKRIVEISVVAASLKKK